ncbi:MAG TPA: aldehyde dehydrogenase family protein [Pseudonocardia sp.]|uniref:aldehyde dehydrogenase family protein n=1 Tax=Pseudonocardia sp. TaxID=60912 RepID=UPI002B4B0E4B|nr:aldehyde dehydrogenase family protein [Pseudonocardia sp.]HLU56129.1 aldehyde dehydrogenase family protein [Pseudonocardia sp.]
MAEFFHGRMLIDGKLTEAVDGEHLESVNPATEEVIGRVPAGKAADVAAAADAADRAAPAWAALSAQERGSLLKEVASALRAESDRIVDLEIRDSGNTIRKLKLDIAAAAESLEYYAALAGELKGETVPATAHGLHFSMREPFGVVGRIVPFNHPIFFAAGKMAAPLAAGNTMVIKPSEQSPLSACVLGEICQQVLPPGVVNIVTGLGSTAGEALVREPRIRRIAFTGSVPTGLAVQRAAAEVAVKSLTLELGGKNPMIVFPDADLDAALPAAVRGMNFNWAGQSCGSQSRLLLHESIYDEGVARVAEIVSGLKVGDPRDPASDMGPVNSKAQYEKVLRYIDHAEQDGARLVAGGHSLRGEAFPSGYWVEPTVFADVTPEMRLFREEVFGPILSIVRWSTPDEAVALANDVEYGLTASVWTRDLATALDTVRRIEAGYIWVNGVSIHFPGTSFGGFKNSGIGREEGIEELYSYTQPKFVHVNAMPR